MISIQVGNHIGLGDAVQFTSIPENYFREYGTKLLDIEKHFVFDHNPYVVRVNHEVVPTVNLNLWNLHCLDTPISFRERTIYLCNAEAHSRHFKYEVRLNRPRLYRFEEYPFSERKYVILHVKGKSHGPMPEHIVAHVREKYGALVRWVGQPEDWNYGIPSPPRIPTPTFWDLAETISKARMFIGMDSGPSWVAACYPDVQLKKIRSWPSPEKLRNWVPLECCRLDSLWDDRIALYYNQSEEDCGFTQSYRRL